jgi:ketosteroid isomerase-like protein
MSDNTSPALRTALAYFEAWTGHDLDAALSYLADDFVGDTPGGRLAGAPAFREFMAPFIQILTGSRLIAAFGDEHTALIMYDTQTVPVPSAPAAECLTVRDGKITHDRFIFDRVPFQAARQQAEATSQAAG